MLIILSIYNLFQELIEGRNVLAVSGTNVGQGTIQLIIVADLNGLCIKYWFDLQVYYEVIYQLLSTLLQVVVGDLLEQLHRRDVGKESISDERLQAV